MYRLLMTGHRPERTGVLFMPFRTRTAHVVQFGSIGIKNPFRGPAPNLDHHHQTAAEKTASAADLDGRNIRMVARLTAIIPSGWSFSRSMGRLIAAVSPSAR